MATLAELASLRTELDEPTIDHLLRLTASWSLLSDLSFSDLLLMTPCVEPHNRGEADYVVLGQVRPNNRSTLITDDLVGTTRRADKWPLAREAFRSEKQIIGSMELEGTKDEVLTWCIPVKYQGVTVAVLVRVQGPLRGPASLYEQAYLGIFERLCAMVSGGTFPFREGDVAGPGMPRVGDGIVLIDGRGLIEFSTPNATNAFHRLGIYAAGAGTGESQGTAAGAFVGFPLNKVCVAGKTGTAQAFGKNATSVFASASWNEHSSLAFRQWKK